MAPQSIGGEEAKLKGMDYTFLSGKYVLARTYGGGVILGGFDLFGRSEDHIYITPGLLAELTVLHDPTEGKDFLIGPSKGKK